MEVFRFEVSSSDLRLVRIIMSIRRCLRMEPINTLTARCNKSQKRTVMQLILGFFFSCHPHTNVIGRQYKTCTGPCILYRRHHQC